MYQNLFGQRNEICFLLTEFGGNEQLTVTTFDFTEGDLTIDLGYYSRVRRVTSLEQLRDTRQTGGNITTAVGSTSHGEQGISDLNGCAVGEDKGCFHRQVIGTKDIAFLIYDMSLRHLGLILGIGNRNLTLTGLLINLRLRGYTLDDIFVFDETVLLDYQRSLIRIPFAYYRTLVVFLTRSNEQLSCVRDIEVREYNACLLIFEGHSVLTANDDNISCSSRDGTQIFDLHDTFTGQFVCTLCSSTTCQTTGVEGTEGQLSTRLTDSLCCDDTDCFTLLNHLTGCQVTSVTLSTYTVFGFAGEYRTDLYLFNTCSLDSFALRLADLLTGSYDELTFVVENIVNRYTTEDTESQRSDRVTVSIFDSACGQTTEGTTVFLIDDHVVRYIDQTTGQITGIGSLQSGIGKTLTGTVGRDEVLQHGHSLFEVCEDRVLDIGTGVGRTGLQRLTHDTTDTCQLFDLLLVTTSTGIHHHVNGVKALVSTLHMIHQNRGHLAVDLLPSINYLTVTLIIGNLTFVIEFGNLIHDLVTLINEGFLLLRDKNIIEVEGQTTTECTVVTQVFNIIEELSCASHTTGLDHLRDDGLNSTFLHEHILESELFRYVLVNDHTTRSRLNEYTVDTHFDLSVDIYTTFVQSHDSLFFRVESETFSLHACTFLSNIIQTKDHILRRNGNRVSVCGVKDVMGSQHQELCLQNSLVAQRQVNSHLVTIEVGVKSGTGQWVQLNSLTLDHLRLERQDTVTVQCRSTVQQNGVSFHHMLKNLIDNRLTAIDDLLSRLNRLHDTALNELTDDKRFIEFGSHLFRQTALVHLQLRTYHDNRTSGVVHTFTEQVLTETSLFTLERVRERFQRTVSLGLHSRSLTAVIEERVHCLLQHTFLVTQDHIRSLDLNQTFETVVTDDDATIEVVEVRGRKTTTVQRNERTKLRRSYRQRLKNHPLRTVLTVRCTERLYYLQTFECFLTTLYRGRFVCCSTQLIAEFIEIEAAEQVIDCFSTHLNNYLVRIGIL